MKKVIAMILVLISIFVTLTACGCSDKSFLDMVQDGIQYGADHPAKIPGLD